MPFRMIIVIYGTGPWVRPMCPDTNGSLKVYWLSGDGHLVVVGHGVVCKRKQDSWIHMCPHIQRGRQIDQSRKNGACPPTTKSYDGLTL